MFVGSKTMTELSGAYRLYKAILIGLIKLSQFNIKT